MENRKNFFRMLKFVRPYAFMYCLGVFLYTAQGFFFTFVSGLFFGNVVDGILALDFGMVVDAIVFIVVALIVICLMVGFGMYLYFLSTARADGDLIFAVFSSFMKSSVEGEKHSGEGIAAISDDADTAVDVYGNAITQFLMPALSIGMLLVAVFVIDWRMGLGTLLLFLITYFTQSGFAGPLARIGKARLEANAEAVKSVSNIFSGALTIRAFSRQERALMLFDKENGKLRKLDLKEAFWTPRGIYAPLCRAGSLYCLFLDSEVFWFCKAI